ncbi:MAG: M23 family metallopeptidase [Bacteroidales bacterium]|nr:M23 family metallopeptidase [Bacteroidales bacterium]
MIKKQQIESAKPLKQSLPKSDIVLKLKKYVLRPILVLLLSLIISIISSLIFETPEEYALKLENAQHLKNIELIQAELDNVNIALRDLQERDDDIYRKVLGVAPIAEEIRSAGIGGSLEDNSTEPIPNDLKLSAYRKELNQLNAKLKVQSVSFDELTTLATENINRLQHRPSIFPLAPSDLIRFASGFGYRTHPIFHIRKFHKGVDLTALKGSPVYSTAKGTVIVASNLNDGYGNKVVVDNGYGYKTIYAHLHKIQVKIGQELNLGDLIGQVGNTGISVSPHLHYEIRYNDNPINPMSFIFKDISSEEYQLITQR